MQPQVVHEAEVHRQHVRLKIPIVVEIDGTRFPVDDWSMGGFGIDSAISSRQPGERFPVRLIFPFEDFEVSLRLDCQMVYILENNTRFGCKFMGLSQGQAALFRYLIDAYLSGELVSGGDLLALAGRDNTAEARAQPLAFGPYGGRTGFGYRLRQAFGYLFLTLLAAGLLGLIWLGVNERFLTVHAEQAVVEAPSVRLRAPVAGTLREVETPDLLDPGTPIAVIESGGEAVPLTSPCICIHQSWLVLPGQFVPQGEEVALLIDANAPLLVEARVPFDEAMRLREGGPATIRLPGQPEPVRGQIERFDFKANAARQARVVVRPDRPLPFEALDSLVEVRFQ